MNNCSLVFLLTIGIALFVGLSEAQCPKNVVTFENALTLSRNNLEVHCKSTYKDLGVHLLKFNETYKFTFSDNKGLEWNCTLRQGGLISNFIAYTGGAIRKCGESDKWTAKDGSIYFSRNGKQEISRTDWFADSTCPKNVVTFRNALTLSRSNLEVHCKSTDDDLGVHVIKFNDLDPTYKFNFTDDKGLNWDCTLQQGGYISSFIAFTGRAIQKCGELDKWTAKDDSIYLSRNGKQEEKLYHWIKK